MTSTVVIGSTGLVLPAISSVRTFTRRAPKDTGAKLNATVEDSAKWAASISAITPPADIFFSGLGTTRAAAGGFDNQRKIDYDLNLEAAQAAKKAGIKVYVLISSGGANPNSMMGYPKMKGELEEAVKALGFEKTVILRPGLILGGRDHLRVGEYAVQGVARLFGAVSGGWLSDGWAQEADVIAKAAVSGGLKALAGEGPASVTLGQPEILRLGRTEWKSEEQNSRRNKTPPESTQPANSTNDALPQNQHLTEPHQTNLEGFLDSSVIEISPVARPIPTRTLISPTSEPSVEWSTPHSPSLSDFGNSTSLFDYHSAESSGFFPVSHQTTNSPVLAAFGRNKKATKGNSQKHSSTMVNERSPAKAPPKPAQQHEPNASRPVAPYPANPALQAPAQPSFAPQFGQPTMPQSPLTKINGQGNQTQSKYNTNSSMFIPTKPARPQFQQPRGVPGQSAAGNFQPSNYAPPPGAATPISKPSAPIYKTTLPAPPTAYGSFGTQYPGGFKPANNQGGGFKPVNNQGGFQSINNYQPTIQPVGQYQNPIDLTRDSFGNIIDLTKDSYRDRLAPAAPYAFVDPKKAAEDLKALLEGAIEDEDDDIPKTRSRKKKLDAQADGLTSMLKGLAVTEDAPVEEDDEDEDDGTVEGVKVKLLPHQVEGLGWMKDRELGTRKKGTVPKGGILADDMGLGKTLQSISLILTNPRPSGSDLEDGKRKFPSAMQKCTLVVAPLALIRQWELEIKDKVLPSHALRVYVHHGPQRTKNYNDLKNYDVVVTTYQILVSEFGNSSQDSDGIKAGCFGLHWYRVILDEAHTIKNRNAKATQACYALRSEYRWCLTGTPMQNNLDELQSLIKFLRIKPYDDLKQWKDQIDRPMKNGRGDVAIKRLQHYLKIFMKRRTKDILKKEGALNPGGKPSVAGAASSTGFKVTERKIEKVFAKFSPEERLFYDRLEKRADKSLEEMMDGQNVNYASALTLLLRLRQACNHPKLVAGKLGKDGEALGAEAATVPSTPRKKAASTEEDLDDLAGMFGDLGVGSKKCDICQLEIGKELAKAGAIRCEECESDLLMSTKKPTRKDRISAIRARHSDIQEEKVKTRKSPPRKARNRNVIDDSDDEDEGSWIVGEDQRGPTKLGKAGGTDDENAEGEGIDVDTDESDKSTDYDTADETELSVVQDTTGEIITIKSDPPSDNESEVEVEAASDIDGSDLDADEAKLSTIVTSTKITHLLSILAKEADEHKFIVFSQFTSMLDLIEPFLQRDGYKYTRYDGSMRNDLREASLKMLREEKSCRILLCSLKCGSLGLNLTAATRVVILEPFWNPFVEEQAIDRVHRLTQKIDVIVYKITIADSVEERILELQEKKRELANQAIEGGKNGGAGKLGMKEIMQLFRRDAEYTEPPLNEPAYQQTQTRVLAPSREASTESGRSVRRSPPVGGQRRVVEEHPVYGRR
ncbi:hypothetical protein V502_04163 [Pseudogymnoascus sp. VKM F-4520 (FW-2644)]|nr:hypothetical protein V502_04163 [Pseudogymnoascus sp. VKM F-4520 (FW-2644)]